MLCSAFLVCSANTFVFCVDKMLFLSIALGLSERLITRINNYARAWRIQNCSKAWVWIKGKKDSLFTPMVNKSWFISHSGSKPSISDAAIWGTSQENSYINNCIEQKHLASGSSSLNDGGTPRRLRRSGDHTEKIGESQKLMLLSALSHTCQPWCV